MEPLKITYEKITGTHRGLGNLSRLWLGPDHLLHVSSNGYTERYRRLYFRDIESITVRHTSKRLYLHTIFGLLALILSAIFSIASMPLLAYGIAYGILVGLAVWNESKGPSCVVVVRTAAISETVKSLSRLKRTRKLVERLQRLIQEAQSEFQSAAPEPTVESTPNLDLGDPNVPPPLPS